MSQASKRRGAGAGATPAAAAPGRGVTLTRLADLRPGEVVDCMVCEQKKPQTEARRFRALWVCGGCAAKLQALPEKRAQ